MKKKSASRSPKVFPASAVRQNPGHDAIEWCGGTKENNIIRFLLYCYADVAGNRKAGQS
jgi:hypothetical protein